MTQFVQLHLLTAYPPSNLNRDDTGKPKSVRLGDAERLRISSQSLKRAWRVAWREAGSFAPQIKGHMADRTQRFGETVAAHLVGKGVDTKTAEETARKVAEVFGKAKSEGVLIEQLAFVPPEEQSRALEAAEAIAKGADAAEALKKILGRADTAIDLALFGRMLAADPGYNREASAQIAHAFTTHRAAIEDDYYTAVDDLKTANEDMGAGFVGELGFGAGLFYIYACVDRDLLTRNLAGDASLANIAIEALVRAAATVSPRGKQASFASRARASYVMVERGTTQPRTLAGAFYKPVKGDDLVGSSIKALTEWMVALDDAYGDAPDRYVMNAYPGAAKGTLAQAIAFARAT